MFDTDQDGVSWFHNRVPSETNELTNEIEKDFQKLAFYQKQTGSYVNDSFDSYVKQVMSESNIAKYLIHVSMRKDKRQSTWIPYYERNRDTEPRERIFKTGTEDIDYP